jgi:hypothetical protein
MLQPFPNDIIDIIFPLIFNILFSNQMLNVLFFSFLQWDFIYGSLKYKIDRLNLDSKDEF